MYLSWCTTTHVFCCDEYNQVPRIAKVRDNLITNVFVLLTWYCKVIKWILFSCFVSIEGVLHITVFMMNTAFTISSVQVFHLVCIYFMPHNCLLCLDKHYCNHLGYLLRILVCLLYDQPFSPQFVRWNICRISFIDPDMASTMTVKQYHFIKTFFV